MRLWQWSLVLRKMDTHIVKEIDMPNTQNTPSQSAERARKMLAQTYNDDGDNALRDALTDLMHLVEQWSRDPERDMKMEALWELDMNNAINLYHAERDSSND